MIKVCQQCSKTYEAWSRKRKFCSQSCFGKHNRPKGTPAWNKGIKGTHFSPDTEFKKGIIPKNSMVFDKSKITFKGTIKEYKALHHRIGKLLGKPNECSKCLSKDKKRYHWANVSGRYKEIKEDWVRLCSKCHYYFDKQYERKIRNIK